MTDAISSTTRKPPLPSSNSRHERPPEPQRDVDEFARVMRRLEEPQRDAEPAGQPAVQGQQSPVLPAAENRMAGSTAGQGEAGGVEPLSAVPGIPEGEAGGRMDAGVEIAPAGMGGEQHLPQDTHLLDATLDTLIPQWLPPAALEAAGPMPASSAMMTLHDFTSLLEQGWRPASPGGEQVWQFRIQEGGLPFTRITLKSDGTVNGGWSLVLAVHGREKLTLSQDLQQLRERLDRLGNNNIASITLSDSEDLQR